MNKILLALGLLISILLCSCGDSHLAKEAPLYKPFVVIVPEKYSGNLESFPVLSSIYVEKDQAFKMYLGLIHGDKQYFGDEASVFLKKILWDIDGEKTSSPSFKYTFDEAGQKKASLTIVDLWNDTVHQEFNFFVNAPNSIAIDFPSNGYNQVNPANNQSLPLRWIMSGIDDWESAECEVFVNSQLDSLWVKPFAQLDCFDELSIYGTLLGSRVIYARDSSFTFYWAVRATIQSEFAGTSYDTTEIAKFSTKILGTVSTIKIPFVYDKYRDFEISQTEISLIAANGDTLSKTVENFSNSIVIRKILPQSGVKIFVRSLNRSDYAPESLMVDIPENTVLELPPIHLKDKIKPQVAFHQIVSSKSKIIEFNVYDDGSGLNEDKLFVVINEDTVSYDFTIPTLQITLQDCSRGCKVNIYGEDYAGNSLPSIFWNIRNVSTVYDIKGPFISEGN